MTRFVRFASTIWTLIRSARGDRQAALDKLVELYRPPVVRYLTRAGAGEHAEDLAQEVFLRIIEKDLLDRVEQSKGKFRSFLLGVANNILREHREHAGAQKRGGGAAHVSLEGAGLQVAAKDERVFTRDWMLHLVRLAMEQLAVSEKPAVRQDLRVFREFIVKRPSYEDLSRTLGITPHAVKNAIYETKQRIRREVGSLINTYAVSQEDFEGELAAFDDHALGEV